MLTFQPRILQLCLQAPMAQISTCTSYIYDCFGRSCDRCSHGGKLSQMAGHAGVEVFETSILLCTASTDIY